MASLRSDGFEQDTLRFASAFGQTTHDVASDLGVGHSNLGKSVRAISGETKIDIPENPVEAPDAEVADGAPLRILIVDDDTLILMNSVDMLEDLGYSVTSAHSGAMALEILKADTMCDLLITDFSMPKMTGLQLAVAVRALLPQLPILLATGYAELPVNSDLALPQLAKPYMQSDLQSAITELMARTGLL